MLHSSSTRALTKFCFENGEGSLTAADFASVAG